MSWRHFLYQTLASCLLLIIHKINLDSKFISPVMWHRAALLCKIWAAVGCSGSSSPDRRSSLSLCLLRRGSRSAARVLTAGRTTGGAATSLAHRWRAGRAPRGAALCCKNTKFCNSPETLSRASSLNLSSVDSPRMKTACVCPWWLVAVLLDSVSPLC